MSFSKALLFILMFSAACNQIKTGDNLTTADIDRIQKLNLLDKNEKIYQFYSEFKNEVAGNFFTDKRIGKYWLNETDRTKNETAFAFYSDIKSIDTINYAGTTHCPYMLVTKTDGSGFRVSVDGSRAKITAFFKQALNKWASCRNVRQPSSLNRGRKQLKISACVLTPRTITSQKPPAK